MLPHARHSLAGVALVLCLALAVSPALAQNPSTAQWQGTRTSGDGVMFLNSGKGVTLQDAGQGVAAFPGGLNISRASIVKTPPNFPPKIPETGIYGVYNNVTGNCGSTGGTCYLNYFQTIESGSSGVGMSAGSFGLMGWSEQAGGSGVTGGRVTSDFAFNLNGTTGNSGVGVNYGAFRASGYASANDNGTSVAPPYLSGHSAIFGGNFVATLLNGATFWNGVVGLEVDLSVDTGASVIDKVGEQVIVLSDDAIAASRYNIGYVLAAQSPSSPGLDIGYSIGNAAGSDPIASTGALFACALHGGPGGTSCGTHAYGINLTNFTGFTTAAFASPGATIDDASNSTTFGPAANRNGLKIIPQGTTLPIRLVGVGVDVGGNQELQIEAGGTGFVSLGNATDGTGFRVLDAGGPIVNALVLTPGKTGSAVQLTAGGVGSDANVSMFVNLKGTGFFRVTTGGPTALQVTATASAAQFLSITNSVAGGPQLSTGGSDTTQPISLNNVGLKLQPKAFAALPACAAAREGEMWGVTDATAPTYNTAITGGSNVHVIAYCNGTSWIAH